MSYESYQDLSELQVKTPHVDRLIRATRNLAHAGYRLIEEVRVPTAKEKHELNYSFWLGKEALPLEVFTEDGQKITVESEKPKYDFPGALTGAISILKNMWWGRRKN